MAVIPIIDEDSLRDIGPAIRSKLNTDRTYLPSEMGAAIRSIKTMDASVSGTTLILTGTAANMSGTTLNLEENNG